MTEAEWMALTDARGMLDPIIAKASERKLRLYSVACCRLVWHLLSDRCRQIVEAFERYADGEAGESDLANLLAGFSPHQVAILDEPGGLQAAEAIRSLGWQWQRGEATTQVRKDYVPSQVGKFVAEALSQTMPWQSARRRRAGLLHDVIGPLPFRPVAVDPAWLAWNHGTVPAIARRVYDERAFHDLPILADALEDAGCTDADILAHCRQGGEHVRGCWVVDLILGKA
jgi:hypothetical protein